MGNQKLKWKSEEEEALLAGIAKHGPGKWKNILNDPDFAPFLTNRSNIDLKDKWRNLSVSNATPGSKDRSRAPKVKTVTVTPPANAKKSSPVDGSADTLMDDTSNGALDGKNAPRYNAMIFEALSTIKDANGVDVSTIVHFIEQKHEVPQTLRRILSLRLKRLVSQGKLEKIQNCYRIKKDASFGTRTPTTPKQKDVRSRPSQNTGLNTGQTVEEAAIAAAYKVAEAENKSFLAAEAVKEAERISKMAEETDALLQLVEEIYEKCSRGETVILS